jgi:hypothetical protein
VQNFILFILSTAGLTWVITRSKLLKAKRERVSFKANVYALIAKRTFLEESACLFYSKLNDFLNCYGCVGVWSGLINFTFIYALNFPAPSYGFAGSIISLTIITALIKLERK